MRLILVILCRNTAIWPLQSSLAIPSPSFFYDALYQLFILCNIITLSNFAIFNFGSNTFFLVFPPPFLFFFSLALFLYLRFYLFSNVCNLHHNSEWKTNPGYLISIKMLIILRKIVLCKGVLNYYQRLSQ